MLWGSSPAVCEQLEEYFVGNMVFFPHFRPIIPIVEKLKEARGWAGHADCALLFNECFINAVFGWSLGTGKCSLPCTCPAPLLSLHLSLPLLHLS